MAGFAVLDFGPVTSFRLLIGSWGWAGHGYIEQGSGDRYQAFREEGTLNRCWRSGGLDLAKPM